MYKFLIFILVGILLYILLNEYNKFTIGCPLIKTTLEGAGGSYYETTTLPTEILEDILRSQGYIRPGEHFPQGVGNPLEIPVGRYEIFDQDLEPGDHNFNDENITVYEFDPGPFEITALFEAQANPEPPGLEEPQDNLEIINELIEDMDEIFQRLTVNDSSSNSNAPSNTPSNAPANDQAYNLYINNNNPPYQTIQLVNWGNPVPQGDDIPQILLHLNQKQYNSLNRIIQDTVTNTDLLTRALWNQLRDALQTDFENGTTNNVMEFLQENMPTDSNSNSSEEDELSNYTFEQLFHETTILQIDQHIDDILSSEDIHNFEKIFNELIKKIDHSIELLGDVNYAAIIINDNVKEYIKKYFKIKFFEIFLLYKDKIKRYKTFLDVNYCSAIMLLQRLDIDFSNIFGIRDQLMCNLQNFNNLRVKNLLRLGYINWSEDYGLKVFGGFITLENLLLCLSDDLLTHIIAVFHLDHWNDPNHDESDYGRYIYEMDITINNILNALLLGVPPEIIHDCLDYIINNFLKENSPKIFLTGYDEIIYSPYLMLFMFLQQEMFTTDEYNDMFNLYIFQYLSDLDPSYFQDYEEINIYLNQLLNENGIVNGVTFHLPRHRNLDDIDNDNIDQDDTSFIFDILVQIRDTPDVRQIIGNDVQLPITAPLHLFLNQNITTTEVLEQHTYRILCGFIQDLVEKWQRSNLVTYAQQSDSSEESGSGPDLDSDPDSGGASGDGGASGGGSSSDDESSSGDRSIKRCRYDP